MNHYFNFATRTSAQLLLVAAALALTACAARQPYGQPAYSPQGYSRQASGPANGVYHAIPANGQPGCTQGIMSDPNVDAVIGGALGGLLGNQMGEGKGKQAMTALGAVAGVVAGHKIGTAYGPC